MDITKRFLQSLLDHIQDSIKIVEKDRTIVFINKAAQETIGKRLANTIGNKCYKEFWHREGPCPHCMMDETFKSGKHQSATVKLEEEGKGPVALELSTFPIKDSTGEVVFGIEILRDVSERELLMNELVQTRALAIMGKYSAELTHEIKNPLNSIAIQIHLMQKLAERAEARLQNEMQDIIRVLKEEVDRLNNLSREYLQISKAPPLELQKCSLHAVLNTVFDLMQPLISLSHIELKTCIDTEIPDVLIDSNKLKQVFINIINNAVEAMPAGGTLTVSMQHTSASVMLSFEDTGPGIPQENKDNIFQPFFSTKSIGSGLGLTVAKNIVEAHGGVIWFERQEHGSTFFVQLPNIPTHGVQ
jgi:PAS domain S-box-containing protein